MSIDDEKNRLRSKLRTYRASVTDSLGISKRIATRLMSMPVVVEAEAVAFYVNVGDEVQTELAIRKCLFDSKRVSVPVVQGNDLRLFEIRSLDELEPGTFRVPEPKFAVQSREERHIDPKSLDLIIVPGLGFDDRGGRIGYGRGFYDRLLRSAPDTFTVALAFECQILEKVPMCENDMPVHCVITEDRLIDCHH